MILWVFWSCWGPPEIIANVLEKKYRTGWISLSVCLSLFASMILFIIYKSSLGLAITQKMFSSLKKSLDMFPKKFLELLIKRGKVTILVMH